MFTRVLAIFVACATLWFGFGTTELPVLTASGQVDAPATVQSSDFGSVFALGSVQHHHLDDQPSQTQADPGGDMPGLVPAPRNEGASIVLNHDAPDAGAAPPRMRWLECPLRPPCPPPSMA